MSPAEIIKREMLLEKRRVAQQRAEGQEKIRWEQFFNEVGEFRQKYMEERAENIIVPAQEYKEEEPKETK